MAADRSTDIDVAVLSRTPHGRATAGPQLPGMEYAALLALGLIAVLLRIRAVGHRRDARWRSLTRARSAAGRTHC